MSRGATRALTTRIGDLEHALKTIGRIIEDQRITPKQRLTQIRGILNMYEATATTPAPPRRVDVTDLTLAADGSLFHVGQRVRHDGTLREGTIKQVDPDLGLGVAFDGADEVAWYTPDEAHQVLELLEDGAK